MQKSNGRLYWYGMAADALDETDLSGSTTNTSFNEYVFFSGKRIARRVSSGNVFYYFADHLGTSRVIVQAGQTTPCYDGDYYPFGGERAAVVNNCPQRYEFTGKERDSETGLDDFGARYYANALGRFISADTPFAGQHPFNPQSWNLYSYVLNNPLKFTDPTGHSPSICNNIASCQPMENSGTNTSGGTVTESDNLTPDPEGVEEETARGATLGSNTHQPTWTEIREYIAKVAREYGVPVRLAESVARHESNMSVELVTPVKDKRGKITSYDYGIMQVNSSNSGSLGGPQGWTFKVDINRVIHDWKYNVYVGMAILRNAYAVVPLHTHGAANIARETYARYNSPHHWKELYSKPNGTVSKHVEQFMKSWHQYDNQ